VQEHDGKSSMVDDDGGPLLLHLTGMQLQRLVTAVITSQSTMRWDEFTQAWQNFPEGLRMLRLFVVGFMTALAAQELAEDAVSQLHVSSEPEPLVDKSELDEMRDDLVKVRQELVTVRVDLVTVRAQSDERLREGARLREQLEKGEEDGNQARSVLKSELRTAGACPSPLKCSGSARPLVPVPYVTKCSAFVG